MRKLKEPPDLIESKLLKKISNAGTALAFKYGTLGMWHLCPEGKEEAVKSLGCTPVVVCGS